MFLDSKQYEIESNCEKKSQLSYIISIWLFKNE